MSFFGACFGLVFVCACVIENERDVVVFWGRTFARLFSWSGEGGEGASNQMFGRREWGEQRHRTGEVAFFGREGHEVRWEEKKKVGASICLGLTKTTRQDYMRQCDIASLSHPHKYPSPSAAPSLFALATRLTFPSLSLSFLSPPKPRFLLSPEFSNRASKKTVDMLDGG